MEISSKKVMYYNDIPLNHFYTNMRNILYIGKYNIVEKILTDEEVEHDLNHIIKLCKTRFNENIQLHIIPHLNLKTKSKLHYICDRNNFVNLLECLCSKYNIQGFPTILLHTSATNKVVYNGDRSGDAIAQFVNDNKK